MGTFNLEESMRLKLKLDLDRLNVESFQTENVPAQKGTVRGHSPMGTATLTWSVDPENTCGQDTCIAVVTCLGETCGGCDTAWKCSLLGC
jgi:hypothetical protein